jgi:hypothetical protein
MPSVSSGSSQLVALGVLHLADLSNPPSTPSPCSDTNFRTSPLLCTTWTSHIVRALDQRVVAVTRLTAKAPYKPAAVKAGGYRGHNHAEKFRVWISGQVRRVTAPIRREMRRRAAVEPFIGHVKAEHRMGRNYLKGRDGDRINAVLAAAGYNFGLLLRWLERLLHALIRLLLAASAPAQNG